HHVLLSGQPWRVATAGSLPAQCLRHSTRSTVSLRTAVRRTAGLIRDGEVLVNYTSLERRSFGLRASDRSRHSPGRNASGSIAGFQTISVSGADRCARPLRNEMRADKRGITGDDVAAIAEWCAIRE